MRELHRTRDQLVAQYQGLVWKEAKRFAAVCPVEDLVQEGNLGLLKAIEKFDPKRGVQFITYATYWVRAFVQRAMGTTRAMVGRWVGGNRVSMPMASLDAPIYDDSDSTMLDTLEAGGAGADEQLEGHQLRQQVRDVIDRMGFTPLQRAVVEQRLLSSVPLTLDQVGAGFGLSRETVRKAEVKALELLERHLAPIAAEVGA